MSESDRFYWCSTHETYHVNGCACSDVNALKPITARQLRECELRQSRFEGGTQISDQQFKLHDRERVVSVVQQKLDGADPLVDIVNMVMTVQNMCYQTGRLSVQNELINTLGLRHILGIGK